MTLRPFLHAVLALVYRSHQATGMGIVQSKAAISRMLDPEAPEPEPAPEPIDNTASLNELNRLMAGLG